MITLETGVCKLCKKEMSNASLRFLRGTVGTYLASKVFCSKTINSFHILMANLDIVEYEAEKQGII